MHGAICTFRVSLGVRLRVGGVWHVFLRDGRQVDDCIGKRVSAAEGENNARRGQLVVEDDVAAAIGEKRACVPCLQDGISTKAPVWAWEAE